jgi:hypothetical protein
MNEDEISGARSTYREMEKSYKISMGTPEKTRSFDRLECSWEDNVRRDIKEMGY